MRLSLALVPLIALGLAACGQSSDAPKDAAASEAASAAAPAPLASLSAEDGAKIAHERHESFEAIGKAMKAMGDELKKGEGASIDTIKASAAKINDSAPKIAGWFPPGSGVAVAPKSDALPAIWEKPAEFQTAVQKFVDEAAKFNTLAQAGDLATIGGGMKALGGTCKGCHDQFKKDDES